MSLNTAPHSGLPLEKNPPKLPPSLSLWSRAEAAKFFHGELTEKIIACAIEVHRELGPGFLESIYEKSFSLELERRQIPYQRQMAVHIRYHGVVVGRHRLDLIIDKKVVVELKAVREIDNAHLAICLSYLKATGLRVGLIINFSEAKTRIRRVMRAPEQTAETAETGRIGGMVLTSSGKTTHRAHRRSSTIKDRIRLVGVRSPEPDVTTWLQGSSPIFRGIGYPSRPEIVSDSS
jgi:GxxExxY protein